MCMWHHVQWKRLERPCLFSATATKKRQQKQPFYKGNTSQKNPLWICIADCSHACSTPQVVSPLPSVLLEWIAGSTCIKNNLLLQHRQKLPVTVLALLRYECSRIFSIRNKLITLKIANFCIYCVAYCVAICKQSGFAYWLSEQMP